MSSLLYQSVRLVLGTLYPAYSSFKAVKTKNVKDYVNWMTYWIVFAIVTITEEISDLLLSFWLPFYYEIKIVFLFWLLSPVTRGSTLIYRQVIHPALLTREEDIDQLLLQWKDHSYRLGVKYTKVAAEKLTKTVIETALAGGGGLVETLRQSYSMSDLRAEGEEEDMTDLGHPRGRRLRYKQSDYAAEMRRSRRLQTGSMLALTSEAHQDRELGGRREESEVPRRRATSVRQKKLGSSSSITPRPSSMYGTLPRRRLPKSPTQEAGPLQGGRLRASRESKESVATIEESDSGDSHSHSHSHSQNQSINSSTRSQRTVSESPSKRGKKSLAASSKAGRKKYINEAKELDNKSFHRKKKIEQKLEEFDFQEDSFSMTYSEEEFKDPKKKCQIS